MRARVRVLCEGTPGGRDILLFAAAAKAVQASGAVDPEIFFDLRPTESKVELTGAVKTLRRPRVDDGRVFALRDRDFLLRREVSQIRHELSGAGSGGFRPWPLERHSIESYLLDDELLLRTFGRTFSEERDEIAEAARWQTVAGAAREAMLKIARDGLNAARIEMPAVSSEEGAVQYAYEVRAAIERRAEVTSGDRPEALVRTYADDLEQDGPLWRRVPGRKLAQALKQRLRARGELPGGDLLGMLTRQAERDPPAALVAEWREFVTRAIAPRLM